MRPTYRVMSLSDQCSSVSCHLPSRCHDVSATWHLVCRAAVAGSPSRRAHPSQRPGFPGRRGYSSVSTTNRLRDGWRRRRHAPDAETDFAVAYLKTWRRELRLCCASDPVGTLTMSTNTRHYDFNVPRISQSTYLLTYVSQCELKVKLLLTMPWPLSKQQIN